MHRMGLNLVGLSQYQHFVQPGTGQGSAAVLLAGRTGVLLLYCSCTALVLNTGTSEVPLCRCSVFHMGRTRAMPMKRSVVV
jgi:hypothetical protein